MPLSNRSLAYSEPTAAMVSALDFIDEEVARLTGPDSTFEEREDAAFSVMRGMFWHRGDRDLQSLVTSADEVEVEGRRYRRMSQSSSTCYAGAWGRHVVNEPLYRQVGIHNGPTIKPIELRAGVVEHMLPSFARIVGEFMAEGTSRKAVRLLRAVGLAPPSRAFLEKRATRMGAEIAATAAALEEAARAVQPPPKGVASVSCGLDRMTVRKAEEADPALLNDRPKRSTPYLRKPPPPKDYHYRMAWVGTATAYDIDGNELHTWRFAVENDADRDALADRVAADVRWLVGSNPRIPVHCIQDGAPELSAMPAAIKRALPEDTPLRELVDFKHTIDYLEKVVDACEPTGDPNNWKSWYWHTLLNEDDGIDKILRKLRRVAEKFPRTEDNERARAAVAAAISYIRRRKAKMRYASHYAAKLPIGSGATEGTCWLMQERVKKPGQSWEDGLPGTLAMRSLVLSDRWNHAWPAYATTHRKEVRDAA